MNWTGSIGYTRRAFDASSMCNCRFIRATSPFLANSQTLAVLDSATSLLPTVMSHNGPFELTTGGPSRNNQQLSVPTLPTSLLPSVDLSPPQRRAVGPDRSFTKAALGKPRPAPYSRSRGPPATSHVGPVWPAWLAPQPATKGSASEGVSPHHCNTPNTFGSSSRAAGEKHLGC